MMDFRDPVSVPLPKTDDEFERICLLIARDRYGPEFYRYGRSGQAQNGIDIYSAYYKGRCLQCKLHKKGISNSKLLAELKDDLQKAKQKFTDLKQFIFAISVETRPVIQDVCKKLSDDKTQVIPWFWNQLQEDIARSKWLLRYCLNYEAGAQWVSDDFLEQEQKKGRDANWQPLQYYSSNNYVQWYGLLKKWDAPRRHYTDICRTIANSFADTYSDMPVAAVVRGDGGSGKSVLLRRLALDLRNDYTVYWIADNAEEFLSNEWLYDIDKNSTEKYLLILEDWYRNFASTGDRATANRLLQKVKSKSNVRLLIGDRPALYTYYPKTDNIIFDLKSEENGTLLSHIINIIPEWKDKFTEEQKLQLLKTGLFQLLFAYQYADTSKPLPKAEDYFLEIIQSDYRRLVNSDNPFYKGLAHALYVYAHLYTDFTLRLSPDALIKLAETYSGTQRPFELEQNALVIADDPVVKRYLDINEIGKFNRLRFLHDTLADEGWKYVQVDSRKTFGSFTTVIEIAEAFKTEKTNNDLSELVYWVLKSKRGILTKEQALSFCDYLINSRCESGYYVRALFMQELIEISDEDRFNYLKRLIGFGNKQNGFWVEITTWINKNLLKRKQLGIFQQLVEAGNVCPSVLKNYYLLLDDSELRKKATTDFTVERLRDRSFFHIVSPFFKRLGHDNEIRSVIRNYLLSTEDERDMNIFTACLELLKDEKIAKDAARKYLQSSEPEKTPENFTTCLKLLKDEPIAKEKALEYLQSPESEKTSANFTTCLQLLKDESIAKEKALEYLQSPESEKTPENFTTCLKLLKDKPIAKEKALEYLQSPGSEKTPANFTTCLKLLKDKPIAKEKALEYLQSPESEKTPANFTTCLKVLGEEAADVAAGILESPIERWDHRIIYRALQIAAETEKLEIVAENMVRRILIAKPEHYNKAAQKQYYLYLQMMKVPLFRLKLWQTEVNKLLQNELNLNRDMFYSLTLSHIQKPEPLAEACLFYLRNWKQEFQQPKKYWGYFIRCLAHPIIVEQPHMKEEIRQLCSQMLLADNCPFELKSWLRLITEEKKFPSWKRAEDDEL